MLLLLGWSLLLLLPPPPPPLLLLPLLLLLPGMVGHHAAPTGKVFVDAAGCGWTPCFCFVDGMIPTNHPTNQKRQVRRKNVHGASWHASSISHHKGTEESNILENIDYAIRHTFSAFWL